MAQRSNTPPLAAIVLAAGLSSRMGGPNKLLTPYRGKPLVRHAIDLVNELDLAQRIVVTGRDAEAVSRVVPTGFEAVFNSRFTDGMGSSIAAGAAALRPEIGGVLIFLGDTPDIQNTDVLAVIDAFDGQHAIAQESRGLVIPAPDQVRGKLAGIPLLVAAHSKLDPGFRRGDDAAAFEARKRIVVPVHEGRRGHPVLFGASHFAALATLDGDRGARAIIDAHADAVIDVAASAGVLRDIDTAGDLDGAY